MPDGSTPSQIAARSAMQEESAEPGSPERSHPGGSRSFSLRSLFRKRSSRSNGETLHSGEGRERPLSQAERAMIERVVALESVRVGDVAIPRADIIALDLEEGLHEALQTFAQAEHSRLPIYRGDLDDPVGFIHIKDVVGEVARTEDAEARKPLAALVRKLLYAPPSMPVADLLLRMQAQRIHMALVIDEFGGTDGLVTIEDLIEEIVGDIRDEHDEAEEMRLRQTPGGRWDCDARLELEILADRLGIDLRLEEEEADTLGGLVFSLAGRVPVRGEIVPHPSGHEFEIVDADPRRVRRVLIRLRSAESGARTEA